MVAREHGLPPRPVSRPPDGSGVDLYLSDDLGSDWQDVGGAPLFVLGIGGPKNGSAVRDRTGRPIAFTDPATCQAVAAFLVAAGHPPLRAPVHVSNEAGTRVIATDEEAHAALLELLDDLSGFRAQVAEIAACC